MGGSGSGGWTPSVPSDPCEQVSFSAIINSPQPAVVAQLNKGDVLDVQLKTAPQTMVAVEYKGSVAGSLIGPHITSLINCLRNGYQFGAEVISIAGGKCTVEISPK